MTVAAVALGWIMSGRALRPVRTMTAAAQRISEHNLDERLAMTGPDDELKELGDTIDGLLERLEGAFSAQRRFVANASHELRTPLTTMRASLDVALAKPDPAPPQTVALAGRLRVELDRVDRLLEAFLVLARAQHRDLPGHTVLPLDYAVSAALADQAAAIDTLRLTVQHDGDPGGAWVAGSHALLSRMVENVIDNAVCHNQDGGWIRVTAGTCDGRATLIVENGGPVLGQEQVSQLSQPFRRLGADRTGSDTGSGLGLSIVAAIAEAHGGALSLHARDGGGLRVSIELPAAAATAIAGALA
jgi:signal transduction histidine kinase